MPIIMLSRKRHRPNPGETSSSSLPPPLLARESSTSQTQSTSEPATSQPQQQKQASPTKSANGNKYLLRNSPQKEIRKTRSWYGSWPAPKATASISVAKENIFGGTVKSNKVPDLSRFELRKGCDAESLDSANGTTPRLSKISENKSNEAMSPPGSKSNGGPKTENEALAAVVNKAGKGMKKGGETKEAIQQPSASETNGQVSKANDAEGDKQLEEQKPGPATPQQSVTSSGWFGWWTKAPPTEAQMAPASPAPTPEAAKGPSEPRPVTPPAQTAPQEPTIESTQAPQPAPSSSWFGFWSTPAPTTPAPVTPAAKPDDNKKGNPPSQLAPSNLPVEIPKPQTLASPQKSGSAPKAGSTWAFWAKESPNSKGKTVEPESGEIAVMGEGSEAHPKPMAEGNMSPPPSKEANQAKDSLPIRRSTWRRNKRARPQSMDLDTRPPSPFGASTPTNASAPAREITQTNIPPKVDSSNKSIAGSEASAKSSPNLLLPSFSSTYQMKENPSILKQVSQFILRTQQAPANHVFRLKTPPKIRKAIAIGVHGLFPATYLRPMIGQPTGTSLRFASLCADAIRRWADAHGCGDCEIEKVALEGEGKINERVDNLWKLMLNWIEHIRSADLVLIACHSQGVPVSIMLLEKLIDLGIITRARVGVCAMAGVALGPFPDYKSGILMGSAAELWEFGNPDSENSKRFEASLKRILDYGVRITFIGSIDDQLVPMESAVYSPANHPYIYRAVFIDGRIHAPDFIAHLVGFALKLRNLGVSDHGLIRELSIPLAGSLYSGEGHSRLYFDQAVYDLAIKHALETTTIGNSVVKPECTVRRHEGLTTPNPYVLPWIMRGLLEEDYVRTELSSETEELLRQFDDWKPANKALKDVKYRLEAVRSKL